ncbi:hypothetical protein [Peribacillus butanolivorans]|uniref:DUF2479 domain-containing protein n=1 Tax=Peribacillus butanolivorans TaxID=421767 RepID=A0ABM6XN32_9BACI|nr:hypothetical protein [Peribacillus butanolivorans]AXN39831.1 hypothetical protein DTO10_16670 [Peribacillus butanolivorans]
MTKEQPKVHLIADESIGGIKREFIEVGRKAKVGDYVRLVHIETEFIADEGTIAQINSDIEDGDVRTLEPTSIVHIDDQRYQLAERKAKVGELVLVIKPGIFKVGDIFEVATNEFPFPAVGTDDGINALEGEYRVLIPVDSAPAEPTPDIDILANLVARVHELESKLSSKEEFDCGVDKRLNKLERITGELVRSKSSVENKLGSVESQLNDAIRNTERLAQELEREKEFRASIYEKVSDLKDEVESNTKDIAFLDGKPAKSTPLIVNSLNLTIKESADVANINALLLKAIKEGGGASA